MFLFTFTKLRKRIFVALLTAFIGVPLLFLFVIFVRIPILSTSLWRIAIFALSFPFFLSASFSWAIFGYGHFFERSIVGVVPNGVLGVVITLIFYMLLPFLFSLIGNFKKDVEYVPWKEAISKRYLTKLFLIIVGIGAFAILFLGLEQVFILFL